MPAAKVSYKPGKRTHEYYVFVNNGMVQKWRADKSNPLIDVVQSYDIFVSSTGSGTEGLAVRPSKSELENEFGTSDTTKILEEILEHGAIHETYHFKDKFGTTNEANADGGSYRR